MGTDMKAEPDRGRDLVLLNAFIDGELSAADRVAVAERFATDADFARAHVTLARLKACVTAGPDDGADIALPARRRRIPWAALAAAAATIACVAVLAGADLLRRHPAGGAEPGTATLVVLATLPSRTLRPRLDLAGLSLVAISEQPSGASGTGPAVVATYRGPHGCRLDLAAGPAGRDLPRAEGSSRHGWTVGDVRYELVAHGMPRWRFALIAEAAENQTRSGPLPQALERRLREARASAPPCA